MCLCCQINQPIFYELSSREILFSIKFQTPWLRTGATIFINPYREGQKRKTDLKKFKNAVPKEKFDTASSLY